MHNINVIEQIDEIYLSWTSPDSKKEIDNALMNIEIDAPLLKKLIQCEYVWCIPKQFLEKHDLKNEFSLSSKEIANLTMQLSAEGDDEYFNDFLNHTTFHRKDIEQIALSWNISVFLYRTPKMILNDLDQGWFGVLKVLLELELFDDVEKLIEWWSYTFIWYEITSLLLDKWQIWLLQDHLSDTTNADIPVFEFSYPDNNKILIKFLEHNWEDVVLDHLDKFHVKDYDSWINHNYNNITVATLEKVKALSTKVYEKIKDIVLD